MPVPDGVKQGVTGEKFCSNTKYLCLLHLLPDPTVYNNSNNNNYNKNNVESYHLLNLDYVVRHSAKHIHFPISSNPQTPKTRCYQHICPSFADGPGMAKILDFGSSLVHSLFLLLKCIHPFLQQRLIEHLLCPRPCFSLHMLSGKR